MKTEMRSLHASIFVASAFRIIGALTILFGLFCLYLFFINMNARAHGGHDLSRVVYFAAYFVPVGLGMLFLRKVFAILISLPCLAMGLWVVILSLFNIPFPWMLINMAFGLILLVPAYLTVRKWRELK